MNHLLKQSPVFFITALALFLSYLSLNFKSFICSCSWMHMTDSLFLYSYDFKGFLLISLKLT